MKVIRWCVLALMLLCLLAPSSSFAKIVEIPLNAAKGIAPYPEGYLSKTEYKDPSIHVTIGTGKIYRTNYWYARVKIANASQMRTHMAGSFTKKDERTIASQAGKVQPVICINGDNFPERDGVGFVARQGVVYLKANNRVESRSKRRLDVLIIDDKGDLHILKQASNEDIDAFEGKIIQGFSFGPGLIIDGVVQDDIVDMGNAPFKEARRACIAQTGPLEYLCIICEGPEDRSVRPRVGLTIPQFAELVASFEGIQNAYMMDGGSAAGMIFKDARVNPNGKSRPLKDILYFASAYVPDPEPEAEAEATAAP